VKSPHPVTLPPNRFAITLLPGRLRVAMVFMLWSSVVLPGSRASADPVVVFDRIAPLLNQSYTYTAGLEGSQMFDRDWGFTYWNNRVGSRWVQPVAGTASEASFVVYAAESYATPADLVASQPRLHFYGLGVTSGSSSFSNLSTFATGDRSFDVTALPYTIDPWDPRGSIDAPYSSYLVVVDLSDVDPPVTLQAGREYVMALSCQDTRNWYMSYADIPNPYVLDREDLLGTTQNGSFVVGPAPATQLGADYPQYGSSLVVDVTFESPLYWDGLGNGNWDSSTRWEGGVSGAVPDAVTETTVLTDTVTVSANRYAGSLSVVDGGVLSVAPSRKLDVTTFVEVAGGTLDIDGTLYAREILWVDRGALDVQGTLHTRELSVIAGTLDHRGTIDTRDVLIYGGAFNVLGGGSVSSGRLTIDDAVVEDLVLPGEVSVSGSGSNWQTGTYGVIVGDIGQGYLTIGSGASVSNAWASIAYYDTAEGSVNVTGPNAVWNNAGTVYVGDGGLGTLRVENGASVSSFGASLGYMENTGEGYVVVTGAGSTWEMEDSLVVGDSGYGSLRVENGAAVCNSWASLGFLETAYGEVAVNGPGADWDCSDALLVGEEGWGTLIVENGATVSNTWAEIGYAASGFGVVEVAGSNSTWTCSDYLAVGGDGQGAAVITEGAQLNTAAQIIVGAVGTGSLEISGGGSVTSLKAGSSSGSSGLIAMEPGSSGEVLISGAGATWTQDGSLSVGFRGQGSLWVEAGGAVQSAGAFIARYFGTTGQATIIGSGSQWAAGGALYVGGNETMAGGFGTLTVADAGQVGAGQLVVYGGGTMAWGLGPAGDARVAVTGNAQLRSGSTLDLQVVGVGSPGLSRHTILSAGGGIFGSFSTVPPIHVPGAGPTGHLGQGVFHRGLNYEGRVGPSDPAAVVSVDLFVAPAGDADGDGLVNDSDVAIFQAHFNGDDPQAAPAFTWTDGDTSGGATGRGDGYVDGQDLNALVAHLGGGGGSGGSAAARYCPATGEFAVSVDSVMSWTLASNGRFLDSTYAAVLDRFAGGDASELPSANENTIGEGTLTGRIGYPDMVYLGHLVQPGTSPDAVVLQYVTDLGNPQQWGTITVTPDPPTVVQGRHLFYNHSAFDGNDAVLDGGDETAAALDKAPLRPGHTATFDNYTSFHRGINGLMIDVHNLAQPEALDAEHVGQYFRFRVGNDDDPDAWADAPPIEDILVRPGEGEYGSDRVMITWTDRAIENQWLQVTLLANDRTGLDEDDVFYFGNAIAEAGDSFSNALVTVADLLLARNNPHSFLDPAGIDFPYDYNRDGLVNATDVLLARNSQSHFLSDLNLITVPDPAPQAQIAPVPEPSALVLLSTAAAGLLFCAWRRRRAG